MKNVCFVKMFKHMIKVYFNLEIAIRAPVWYNGIARGS
jgi:hypothetical protein